LQAIEILTNAIRNFTRRCVDGIGANRDRCRELAEKSLAVVTALVPKLGYDRAAEVAKRAFEENRSIREVAEEMRLAPPEELGRLLDLELMARARL
jgi:fumarate hydratase class II